MGRVRRCARRLEHYRGNQDVTVIPFEELKASVALSALVGRTVPLKRAGRELKGLCPFHAEKTESFFVNDASGFYHCFGCGAHGDAFDWLRLKSGMEPKEAAEYLGYKNGHADAAKANGHRTPAKDTWISGIPPVTTNPPDIAGFDHVYRYTDSDGRTLRYIARKDARGSERKQFVPITWGTMDGHTGWHKRHASIPRSLYGLQQVDEQPDAMVVVCEGEKAADAARAILGLPCVTWSGGTNSVHQNDWRPLAGREVVIWPDNDAPGHKAAEEIKLLLRGTAKSVRILPVRDLADKYDAADLPPDTPEAWFHDRLKPAPEASARRILTGAEFIAAHVPPVWLIDGVVQRGRLYACTSLTGHGKTAVWLFNACMIHAGQPIGNVDTFRGDTLILAGENPSDLEARMIGMAKTHKIPANQLPYVLPGSFPMTKEQAEALKADIARIGVSFALIVGDTASAYFPGDDENSNVQAGEYARTLRTFTTECRGNPAVVVLSHPVKGAARGNLLPRGGGAFLNELDGNLCNWSDAMGETTEMHWCGKIRGPDFSPLGYRLRAVPTGLLDEKRRAEMTIVAEPMSEEAVADHFRQTTANEDVVLRAIRDHPEWSYSQICREVGWADEDGMPMKPRVQRAIRALADDKLIVKTRKGDPWEITEKGEKALAKSNYK